MGTKQKRDIPLAFLKILFGFAFLFFLAWTGVSDSLDKAHIINTTPDKEILQYQDSESYLGPIFSKRPPKPKPVNPLISELHKARQAGDEQKMREIEAKLMPAIKTGGESKGPVTHRISTTRGHPGEAPFFKKVPPTNIPTDWGTDIHVRTTNTTFQESYPAMATASDGTIYMVWENRGSPNPHNYLQVYYSTDGGDTWMAYGWFENPNYDLGEPSLTIGEGMVDMLIIAYVVMDAVPYIEVMTTPLASGSGWSPTFKTPYYYSTWESYHKPCVWTDSYDWSGYYIYLTAEAAVNSTNGNYNVIFWRSVDFGNSYTSPAAVPLGNLDAFTWLDPDGTYGTIGNKIFIACFNATDSTIYTLISLDYGLSWSDTISVYKLPEIPFFPVDPDIEAATASDNIQIVCTKSFAGNDNIGQTYSQDAGQTWSYLYSLEGYTILNEYAPELTANEGGFSWHLTYTSNHNVFYSTRPQNLSSFWSLVPEVVDDAQYASADYNKKAITSNRTTDDPGIAWADYRDGVPDYDIYFDKNITGQTLYKGPASGSITSGAMQNTNNFADFSEKSETSEAVLQKIMRYRDTGPAPDPPNLIPAAGPPGSNRVDDLSATDAAPTLLTSFEGIPDDQNSAGYTFIPPDPTCAAGPNYIMACTNTDFAIFDKMGNKLKEIDATLWFENVLPGLDPGFAEPFGVAYDPQIVYDHFEDRWVMIYIADDNASQSYLLLSVSDDSDPFGVWANYAIPGNQNGSIVNTFQNDYPKLGLDNYNLYITANMFDLVSGAFQYIQVRVIEKSQIYTNMGGPLTFIDFWDLRDPDNLNTVLNTASTVVPAVTFGTPGAEYFINASPYVTGTFMTLWTLTDPASPSTLTAVNIPVTAYRDPPDADQLGGGTPLIDVGGRRVRNAVYRNGHIITAHSIADVSGGYAEIHFVEIDIPTLTPVVDAAFGSFGYWYFYPAVTLDPSMNGIAVFNRSGTMEYAGIRYTGIVGGVPQASAILRFGLSNYIKTFGGTRNRWGDYSGIAIDPANPDNVWMYAEYAASPANTWGTYWGEVSYGSISHPPAENLVALDGYDHYIPVYWDPPSGISPLEDETPGLELAQVELTRSAPKPQKKAEKSPDTSDGILSALLSYNVYRSTSPGGPYTFIANVNRQYYRDETVTNGTTYYYVVEAVYDDGVSVYSNEDDAASTGGYTISNGYATSYPTIDGNIDPTEWNSAAVIDISVPPATNPVTFYAMNDGNFLYIAVDDPNNTSVEASDQIGIYFDEDYNHEWPAASPSGEGNFWVLWDGAAVQTQYRGIRGWWPANLGYDSPIIPAPGVSANMSYSGGHAQFEVAIDLVTSDLNAQPGDKIGLYVYSYDGATSAFLGNWPEISFYNAPFTFGTMTLASSPVLQPPMALYAYPEYDGVIPLAWMPPTGYPPFDARMGDISSVPQNSLESEKMQAQGFHTGKLAASPEQSLLSYNIYRGTSPGGPYTQIANGVTRQYYRDETVINGTTYYYVVTAVYDIGESDYSYEVSANAVAGGYTIHSFFTNSPPVTDGFIAPGEWSMAQVVDVTKPGNPDPVTMYVMNDGGFLYLAVDNPGNLTLEDYDQFGVYFDENLDREWPPLLPSTEGNFWFEYLSGVSRSVFRGIAGWWPDSVYFDIPVSPAAGVALGISTVSGHVQYEVAIDLSASALNVLPGDKFGMFIFTENMPTGIFDGWWPQATRTSIFFDDWEMPAAYGDVYLATTGPDFIVDLMVKDNCANSQNLVFGTAPDATLGFDPQYDQYAPPPPPSGAFDARFRNSVDDFLKDFRPTNTGTTIWDVHFQPSAGCTPMQLVWNPSQLPATGYFYLRDAVTGNLVNLDMRTHSSYTDNLMLGHLQIVYSLQQTFQQEIFGGWNLLGLPMELASHYYLDLYPNAVPNTCFGWNGAYYNEDSLDLGMGYWLRFQNADTVSLTGNPVSSLNIPLQGGWNMISGGVKAAVALADVVDPAGIIIPGTLYGFNGAYYNADSIKRGKGYWLRTTAAGTITLNATRKNPSLSKTNLNPPELTRASSLEISDGSGAVQTLYFGVETEKPEDILSYSLPPLPPAGAFDARFVGDFRATESLEPEILVQVAANPLRITARSLNIPEGHSLSLLVMEQNETAQSYKLSEGSTIELNQPNIRHLKICLSEEIPLKFTVEQNYPNPFNPITQIRYELPENARVVVSVYNTLGQQVKTIYRGFQEAGRYSVNWDGTNDLGEMVGSGIYFYRVEAGPYTAIRKMILLK